MSQSRRLALAFLVCHRAGCFAGGLAGSLALSAAALFSRRLQTRSVDGLDMLHGILLLEPFYALIIAHIFQQFKYFFAFSRDSPALCKFRRHFASQNRSQCQKIRHYPGNRLAFRLSISPCPHCQVPQNRICLCQIARTESVQHRSVLLSVVFSYPKTGSSFRACVMPTITASVIPAAACTENPFAFVLFSPTHLLQCHLGSFHASFSNYSRHRSSSNTKSSPASTFSSPFLIFRKPPSRTSHAF